MELYISDNLVSSLRELFSLKSLTCLIVLDMTFNPVVFVENYRPFIVFHLTALKALDGRPIVSACMYNYMQSMLNCVCM